MAQTIEQRAMVIEGLARDPSEIALHAAKLEAALKQSLAWWEAGLIVAGSTMSKREVDAFNEYRALINLPPVMSYENAMFSKPNEERGNK